MPRKPKPPPPEPKRHERAWGAGTVAETRPGRWRAFRARQPDGTRPSRTFASREQAEVWARGDVQPDVLLFVVAVVTAAVWIVGYWLLGGPAV